MPHICNGQHSTLTIDAGKALVVTCGSTATATVWLYPAAQGLQATGRVAIAASQSRTFGPFVSMARVDVVAEGGPVSYVYADGANKQLVTADQAADGSAGALVVSGRAARAVGLGVSAKANITGIGDSKMAYGVSAAGAPTCVSHIAWAFGALPGVQARVVQNRGVGGSTIQAAISSQLNDALTDDSDILWIHSGVNNLNPGIDATLPTPAKIQSLMRRLLDKASPVKSLIGLDAITPLALDSISGAAPRRADIPIVNELYRQLALEYPNVIYNDIYTDMAIDATSGTAKPGMTLATDGIHFTTLGAYTAGRATARNLAASQVALRQTHRATFVSDLPGIGGSSGTKTPGAGTINGSVADDCNVEIPTNPSGVVVTATVNAGRENSQRLRIQNGNASQTVVRFQLANFTTHAGNYAQNDVASASCYIEVQASQVGLRRMDFALQQNPAGAATTYSSFVKSTSEDGSGDPFPTFPTERFIHRACVPPSVLTAVTAGINVVATIEVAPGGDVTVDLSGWTLQKVTPV